MKVIDFLHRSLFSCCSSSNSLTTQRKKRITKIKPHNHHQPSQPSPSPSPSSPFNLTDDKNPPPPSKSNVIGTIFGHRRARARFCIQHNSHISKPLLLELPMPTYLLAEEMKSDLLRISLECHRSQIASCSLHSVPIWTMYCNGRKVGFAARRRATDKDRDVLRTVQATSVGAGVIPPTSAGEEEVMYLRASYERVVGSGDSESFYLINTGKSPSQELSIFLLRTEWGIWGKRIDGPSSSCLEISSGFTCMLRILDE